MKKDNEKNTTEMPFIQITHCFYRMNLRYTAEYNRRGKWCENTFLCLIVCSAAVISPEPPPNRVDNECMHTIEIGAHICIHLIHKAIGSDRHRIEVDGRLWSGVVWL